MEGPGYSPPSISNAPPEVLGLISEHLDIPSMGALSKTSRRLRTIVPRLPQALSISSDESINISELRRFPNVSRVQGAVYISDNTPLWVVSRRLRGDLEVGTSDETLDVREILTLLRIRSSLYPMNKDEVVIVGGIPNRIFVYDNGYLFLSVDETEIPHITEDLKKLIANLSIHTLGLNLYPLENADEPVSAILKLFRGKKITTFVSMGYIPAESVDSALLPDLRTLRFILPEYLEDTDYDPDNNLLYSVNNLFIDSGPQVTQIIGARIYVRIREGTDIISEINDYVGNFENQYPNLVNGDVTFVFQKNMMPPGQDMNYLNTVISQRLQNLRVRYPNLNISYSFL